MNIIDIEQLKYPTGTYNHIKNPSTATLNEWIEQIEQFPSLVDEYTNKLSKNELEWIYRPEGWNSKQVIHHCADSHMNAFIRFKLALTEDEPTIKPYYEDRWAKLHDGNLDDISLSIQLLKAIHTKWVILLRSMSDQDLQRTYKHPEYGAVYNLAGTVGNYAWHCNHHFAHIKNAVATKGKYN